MVASERSVCQPGYAVVVVIVVLVDDKVEILGDDVDIGGLLASVWSS